MFSQEMVSWTKIAKTPKITKDGFDIDFTSGVQASFEPHSFEFSQIGTIVGFGFDAASTFETFLWLREGIKKKNDFF